MVKRHFVGILDSEGSARNAVLVLIATTAVARLVFAGSLGFGIDEAYTVATSRQLQGGYFDHPPMAWWLAALVRAITGSEHPVWMRLPFIIAFGLTTWFIFELTRLLYGLRAGFWAAVLVNIPPAIGWTSGTWVLPDGPLYAAITGGTYAMARVLFIPRQSPFWWLVAGAAFGVALLSKLHGLLFLGGAFLFLLTSPRHRAWLASPWPYLGALLALLLTSPAIIWNVQHDWISIRFQMQRGEAEYVSFVSVLRVLGGQALYLLPLFWLALVTVWVRAVRRGPSASRDWLLVCISIGPIVAFTGTALWAPRVLPHWAVPGYLMVMPLLGREVARGLALAHRWVKPWIWLCAGTTAIVLPLVIALAYLPWPTIWLGGRKPLADPLIETVSWTQVRQELDRRGLTNRPNSVLAGATWHEAARLDLAMVGKHPVICLAFDPRGYGVNVRTPSYLGRQVVLVTSVFTPEQIQGIYAPYFDELSPQPDIVISRAGKPALTVHVFTGRNLHTASGSPYNLIDPLGAWSGHIAPAR